MLVFNPVLNASELCIHKLHLGLVHHIPIVLNLALKCIDLGLVFILQLVDMTETLLMLDQFLLAPR